MMAERISFRDEVAQEIIKRIEAGTAPWQKPWDAGATGVAPFNPTSGKAYRGINDLWLSMRGHADPRWMTYRQAEAVDAHVRKGERATGIEYWQWSVREPLKDENGQPVLDGDGKQQYKSYRLERPRVFYAKVFNAEQIDGLEPWIAPAPAFDPLERAEAIVAGAGVPVLHDQHDRAFYRPMSDEIHLPPLAAFKGRAEYYETVLHELGHATGHGSRLDRFFGPFGSEGYAREELRAEIASYMLARDMGISFDPSNHAAYVESWLKALREDKNEIFHAARDAETIKTWVMEPEQRQALEQAARQKVAGKERSETVSLAPQAAAPVLTADAYAGKIDAVLAPLPNVWQAREALYEAYRAYAGPEAGDLGGPLGIPDRSSQRFGAVFHEGGIPERDVDTLIQRASIAATWPVRAAELLGISDSARELFDLAQTLPRADWYYDYSDDADVRQREGARIGRIHALAKDLVAKSPAHAELVSALWDNLGPRTGLNDLYQPSLDGYVPVTERTNALTRQLSSDPLAATYQALGLPAAFVQITRTAAPALSATADQSLEGPGRAASQGEEPAMPGPSRIRSYIAVPFAEKDEAKGLGAKWDRKEKSWYVPEGLDQAAFAKWSAKAPEPALALSPVDEFADFLKTNGLTVSGTPVMDGRWHRVAVEGDKGKSLSGSYRGFLDGRPSGQVTNFKAGINAAKWVATGVALTDAERAKIQAEAADVRARREVERLEAAQKAAKVAFGVWRNLPGPATPENCPYLKAKGVQGHGVKVDAEGHLVVPARDAGGRLWGVQVFHDDGKRFIKNSHKVGTMHVISAGGGGKLSDIAAGRDAIVIGEGYATSSTIHEATGLPTIVAFDSGNLAAVAQAVRAAYPDREILLAADNDHANRLGNVGVKKAEEAADLVKGLLAVPALDDREKAKGLTDFNDLGTSRGKPAVRQAIEAVLSQARRQSADLGRSVA
jgi:antirestriction protein ArdC/phage/plasmid primase-like uncharacterized protein